MELLENKQKIGIILLAIIAIIGIATYVLWQTNDNHEEEILTQEQNEIQVEPLQEEEEQETIMIHIMGEVQTPGVVTLPEGARMIDAIHAAGGLTEQADMSQINLVYVLEDGLKIKIPSKDNEMYITQENGENVILEDPQGKEGTTMININKAKIEELTELPGIGDAMAQRIIEYREENGDFQQIEDIQNVSGIGEAKFEKLKENICVK